MFRESTVDDWIQCKLTLSVHAIMNKTPESSATQLSRIRLCPTLPYPPNWFCPPFFPAYDPRLSRVCPTYMFHICLAFALPAHPWVSRECPACPAYAPCMPRVCPPFVSRIWKSLSPVCPAYMPRLYPANAYGFSTGLTRNNVQLIFLSLRHGPTKLFLN